jgi:hypothetical protein
MPLIERTGRQARLATCFLAAPVRVSQEVDWHTCAYSQAGAAQESLVSLEARFTGNSRARDLGQFACWDSKARRNGGVSTIADAAALSWACLLASRQPETIVEPGYSVLRISSIAV